MGRDLRIWVDVIAELRRISDRLPSSWPSELPAESDPGLWRAAARLEMACRKEVSGICSRLAAGLELPPISPLHGWFVHRRLEFGLQAILTKVHERIVPDESIPMTEILRIFLISVWDSDGCLAFWNTAIERGGRPHEENPDGLRPLPGM